MARFGMAIVGDVTEEQQVRGLQLYFFQRHSCSYHLYGVPLLHGTLNYAAILPIMSKITEKLKDVVGVGRIMIGDSIAERPTSFWNHDPTQTKAIVLPITTDEVSAILHCCHNHEQSVVVQCVLTNCVAAAVSTLDPVVLALKKRT